MVDEYIGHHNQISGVEEYRLVGGKGDNMRFYNVKNGLGLEFNISLDRAADIGRLTFKGDNYSYLSPCGYVAPTFYDNKGNGFLKSFTGGFLTTCGLENVGVASKDKEEELPLHGRISHTPVEQSYFYEDDNSISIYALINEMTIFSHKVLVKRKIQCSKRENSITIEDEFVNVGDTKAPLMLLYHFNIGYPLLSESAILNIPSSEVIPRNDYAEQFLGTHSKIHKPTRGYKEQCFYHHFSENSGSASIFNPDIGKGMSIDFDTHDLNYFVQWKMLGIKDYVLGLEPGNCHPDGRAKMRAENMLQYINPSESIQKKVTIKMFETDEMKKYIEVRGEN